ncbi:MAG: FAD:protein FMN transferase [Planctomycetota bacterium]|nr:MAG: FAD:protein FMN transferase [Planctomycetota bacterium]
MLLAAILVLAQDPAPPPAPLQVRTYSGAVMGTSLEIEVWGPDPARLEQAVQAAVAEIRRVEDLMTDWRPSPLLDLNAAAGSGPVPVRAELFEVIELACEVADLTGGAFDPTFAAAGRLWDFQAEPPRLPDRKALQDALGRVDWRRVHLDRQASTVALEPGTVLGLDGIAKGYGVDRAMAVLMAHGIRHALVNAGGDLKALGRKGGTELWEIAVRHPRDRERVIAVLPVANTCVVTSGDYERFFELDGRRYHHILDPRTGLPATGCMSATVVAPDAALADSLATALCVLGPKEGLALVARLPRVEALVVGMDGTIQTSAGLRAPAGTSAGRGR